MELQIYHSVNESLYLWNGTSGLLIDGLHRGREIGFSDTSEQYICMMRQGRNFFAKPNDLLFTHIHEDHYDQALVDEFQQRYPGRIVYAPGLDKDNIQEVLRKEVGNVFVHVLEDAGVYKCTPEGREAFMRFINTL